jgi:hypothetical protein
VTFTWSFNDPLGGSANNTSALQNPQHTFAGANTVKPVFIVTSKQGCPSDPVVRTFQVGAVPKAEFNFSGVSGVNGDFLTFQGLSSVDSASFSSSFIDSVRWNFGDNTTQTVLAPIAAPLNHAYPTTGLFTVSMLSYTNFGCVDSIKHDVVILGNSPMPIDNFEGATTEWLPYSGSGGSSWVVGQTLTKSSISIDPLINGSKVWITADAGTYLGSENSALYSPVYDLTQFNRPTVSFNNFTHISNGDGVVLQYSVDDKNTADSTKVWVTLGEYDPVTPSGREWYTDMTLPSVPGGLNSNPAAFAWTGTAQTAWKLSTHSLDFLNTYSRVVFRFALGSVTANPSSDGFAMDNFFIGERDRFVLVENFTSTNVEGDEVTEVQQRAEQLDEMVNATLSSVVVINYHVDYDGTDPFNKDSPQDPSSRALYYSAQKVPYTYVDGYQDPLYRHFEEWGTNTVQLRQLDAPQLTVNMVNVHNTDSGSVKIDKVDIQAIGNVSDAVLFVAIIEDDIDAANPILDKTYLLSGEAKFNYVFKKMLPSAQGAKIPDMAPGAFTSVNSLTWSPGASRIYSNMFRAIAFVQNLVTKEIYQTQISAPFSISNGKAITAIADRLPSLSVYPNPADREMNITRQVAGITDLSVRLIDQRGVTVLEQELKKDDMALRLDTQFLAPALYILQIGDGQNVVRQKVVIIHRN